MSVIGLVHSSDLHFGKSATNEIASKIWPLRLRNPHSFVLARGLSEVLDDVAAQTALEPEQDPYLVMSGDLTATGHEQEFVTGHTFLRSLWRTHRAPPTSVLGFDVRGGASDLLRRLVTVPGNHDHWGGTPFTHLLGYNPARRHVHFRNTPWQRVWQAGELVLEVYGLDSCAGLPANLYAFRQRGKVNRQEILDLDNCLRKATLPRGGKYLVRALVVHHTVQNGGYYDQAPNTFRELAEKYKISAILTGHTHTFWKEELGTLPTGSRRVWELRSASSLQAPSSRTHPSAGFLAHGLKVEKGSVVWRAWRYGWDQSTQQFAVLGEDMARPFAEFIVQP